MNAKYDRIGIDYNETRRADPYLASRLLHHLAPEPGKVYLDIGCGTGNYTSILAGSGGQFIGVDPSEKMLEKARERQVKIDWRKGSAEAIPVEDAAISGVTASFTMHHWTDLKAAFWELRRVMQPGARMVMLTATPKQMAGYWLCHYFPGMMEDSMKQMPDYEKIDEAMWPAGMVISQTEKYFIQNDLQDWFLYNGKHKPERYLEARVRKGISSFSDLARKSEVECGLRQLEADIESGKVNEIIQKYENDFGDYLFIVGNIPTIGIGCIRPNTPQSP